MAEYIITVNFTVEVPDEIDAQDLVLDIFDYSSIEFTPTITTEGTEDLEVEIISHETTTIVKVEDDGS